MRATAERRRITEDGSTAVPANKSSLKRKGNSREKKQERQQPDISKGGFGCFEAKRPYMRV